MFHANSPLSVLGRGLVERNDDLTEELVGESVRLLASSADVTPVRCAEIASLHKNAL